MAVQVKEAVNGEAIGGISREARIYAVRELLRRSGVSPDQYYSWKIDFENGWTIVRNRSASRMQVRFRNSRFRSWQELVTSQLNVARYSWTHPPEASISSLIPDFVVPFTDIVVRSSSPLFQKLGPDQVDCNVDLPL